MKPVQGGRFYAGATLLPPSLKRVFVKAELPLKIAKYPHFDAPISKGDAEELASSPQRVSRHAFLPLISYIKKWEPFTPPGKPKRQAKKRTISYAARRDGYLFAHYRRQLVPLYEIVLKKYGLQDCVLAYRRIATENPNRNKSNINFAREAFEVIKQIGECYAISMDIKGFFDSIDHERLKFAWANLLGQLELPADHFAVFKAVTSFSSVDKLKVYEALGHIGPIQDSTGKLKTGYTKSRSEMPTKLCS
jgi:hypothetical protein